MTWYRYRIVKHRILPEVRFADDPRIPGVLAELRLQAEGDMGLYLRSHHPGQTLVTEFVHQRAEGLQVFVAVTLFGPAEMKAEILDELAKAGAV